MPRRLIELPGIASVESGIVLDEPVAVMTLKNELVCIGPSRMTSEDMVKKERGLAVKPDKVFMQPGTYPKIQRDTLKNTT